MKAEALLQKKELTEAFNLMKTKGVIDYKLLAKFGVEMPSEAANLQKSPDRFELPKLKGQTARQEDTD